MSTFLLSPLPLSLVGRARRGVGLTVERSAGTRGSRFAGARRWALLAAVALGGVELAPGAVAASAAKETAPVLMSRTGGGAWSNLKELEAAVANGNPKAQAQLGEMLLRGEGVTRNDERAVTLLEQAARAGHSGAAFRIGMLLMQGESGVAKDPERALAYFRAAAAGGEKEAFFNIGAAYGSAKGVKRDYGEALGWLIVARKRGADPAAENQLRAQIQRQPSWIAKGERRAREIEQEFAGKTVVELLPPASSLAVVAQEPPSPAPSTPTAPTVDLKPKLPGAPAADPGLKPALPGLPRPTLPSP